MALTSTHWGTYRPRVENDRLVDLDTVPWDRRPSQIGRSLIEGITAPCRIRRPAIRQGFLRNRASSRDGRGAEPFVEVPWDEALDIVAAELKRVKEQHGNSSIFGGSYGWSSAGRFHHAQSQVHRFLNCIGGYVYSVDTYSSGAARRVLPHVIGEMDALRRDHTSWRTLAENCELFVAFGGLPIRNTQVNSGGASEHAVAHWIGELARRGTEFVNISPSKHDLDQVSSTWLPARPGSDAALMLALCHTLIAEGLYDRDFLERCTVGFESVRTYVMGEVDAIPKDADWAAALTDIPPDQIVDLARRMARSRTIINVAWSLQRAQQGEQPFWGAVTLASLLGQIGTPGGGIGLGYSCTNDVGSDRSAFSGPRLPQGRNAVSQYIPVARIADLLRMPNQPFDYDGKKLIYPDIKFVYWAGGNVFHHHQDINRLIVAWRRPEVVVVHEQYWTAQAKFSDIVLPATTMLERDDIGSAAGDGFMVAMKRAVDPIGEARDDYEILTSLAERFNVKDAFCEGRTTMQWLRHLYEESRERASASGFDLPNFDVFWANDYFEYPMPAGSKVLFEDFRSDPATHPLPTPSGRIELWSEKIASFDYSECPGHVFWQAPDDWLGAEKARQFPLHLLSPQPETRLHSQYDHGVTSRASKIADREPLTMNVEDAAERGIRDGDIVRVFNERGAILCGVRTTDGLRRRVVQLATGAWYDPEMPGQIGSLDKHGNPNVLSPDVGTSRLGQGCAAQSTLVQVEKVPGQPPRVTAFDPPPLVTADQDLQ